MGHRSIILLVGALCAFAASHVSALGLGKITLDSTLNQPLKAKISLLELQELTKDEIRVQIAEREDFDRIGIEKTYFLSDLKFNVVLEGPGAPYIDVTSRKLVREPFLNFVVQVRWPSGKLLREYTLLLDLPVFAGQQAPSVQASQQTAPRSSQPAQSSQQSSPADTGYNPRSVYEAAPARPTQQQQVVPTYTEDSYQVRSNDTLWEIAASVRPDSSVSIHQTMLAIQRENPQAFINNNINLLKAGQILRIPDRDEMQNFNKGAAVREVAQQNAEWSGRDYSEDVSDAPLSASNAYTSSSEGGVSPEGRLKLTSPDDAYDSNEGRTSGSSADTSTDALENELAVTLEQLDKSSRENNDLRSKVSSLEEQINTMERMLEVSNESLRALELSAQQQNEQESVAESTEELYEDIESEDESAMEDGAIDDLAIGEVDVDTEIDTESLSDALQEGLSDDESLEESTLDDESEESYTETDETLAEATPEATPTPVAPDVVPPQPQKGIVDIILENILYIVAGVVVLVGGIFFLMRKKSGDDVDDFFEEHGLNDVTNIQPPREQAEDGYEEEEGDLDLGDLEEDEEEAPSLSDFEEELPEDEGDVEQQTEDVVTEADIYIAYGRFDRAEEMLLNALSKDANDENVRLKLLEVYSTQGDAENFDPHYAKLRAFASAPTIERADALRSSIPHIAEFDEGSFDTSDVGGSDTSGDSDIDLSVDIDGPVGEESDAGESLDLDEDISFDLGDESSEPEEQSFDLDLGDLDSDGDPDSGLELELPDEGEIEDATGGDVDLGEGLDLDFDLGDSSDSDGEEVSSDDDLGDLDLDLGDDAGDSGLDDLDSDLSLDTDLADLDTDLSFDIEGDDASDSGSLDDALNLDLNSEPELDSDFGDLNASEKSSEDLSEFAIDEPASVGSDTVVNEALNDEYIEQKLSEDADLDLNLDGDIPLETDEPELSAEFASVGAAPSLEESSETEQEDASDDLAMEDDDELDLSTLDQELDALTADVDSDGIPQMDEPVTDLDAFDDDLERDEASAEVVSTGAEPEKPVDDMGEDTMFNQAMKETPSAESSFEIPEVSAEDVDDDDLDFLSDSDETATKLDLARAYIDMGDQEGARDIIREILAEGNDEQKSEAEGLLARIES